MAKGSKQDTNPSPPTPWCVWVWETTQGRVLLSQYTKASELEIFALHQGDCYLGGRGGGGCPCYYQGDFHGD